MGKPIGQLPSPTKENYSFAGWYLSGNLVTADTVWSLDSELTMLVAKWQPLSYTVTFVADDATVDTQTYTIENRTIKEPAVPEKSGYTGVWEDYSLTTGNVTVNAVYAPIEYTVTFVADEKTVGTQKYTVENKSITEPAVPVVAGYNGSWEAYTLTTGDVTVNAVYDLVEYTVTFVIDEKVVDTQKYSVENKKIDEPAVTEKVGYTAAWEEYTLATGNITVNAVYTPIEYSVTFKADDKVVGVQKYTIENQMVAAPAVPEKRGYVGVWKQYTLSIGNKTVVADYTAIGYSVTFVADDKTVAVLSYTVENRNLYEPIVPQKPGYAGKWENYELSYGNVKVKAVYTPLPKEKVYFACPVEYTGISMGYGPKEDGELIFNQTLNMYLTHKALDLLAEQGTAVVAMFDGTVIDVSETYGMGKIVKIDHGGNIVTTYASLDNVQVTNGQTVKKGEKIGEVSTTAAYEFEDGAHLHLEVTKDGNNVDPTPYIKGEEYLEVVQTESN